MVATTILSDIYTPAERAKIQSGMSVVWGSAAAAGPLLGTLILQFASWRWAFYINIPIGVIIVFLISRYYTDTHERRSHRFVVLGFLLLSAGISSLLLSAGETLNLPGIAVSLLFMVAFIWHESRTSEPLLPLHIARRPAIALSSLAMALLSAAQYGFITYLPLYGSLHPTGSMTGAGLILTPLVIGSFVGSLVGGRVAAAISLRAMALIGAGMAALATIANLAVIYGDLPIFAARADLFLYGAGYWLMALALMLTIQNAAARSERGTANAFFALARSLGIALGVGLLGSVLAHGASGGETIEPAMVPALIASLHIIFIAVCALAVIGFLLLLLLPSAPPETPSSRAEPDEMPPDALIEI